MTFRKSRFKFQASTASLSTWSDVSRMIVSMSCFRSSPWWASLTYRYGTIKAYTSTPIDWLVDFVSSVTVRLNLSHDWSLSSSETDSSIIRLLLLSHQRVSWSVNHEFKILSYFPFRLGCIANATMIDKNYTATHFSFGLQQIVWDLESPVSSLSLLESSEI
jgi:hypothetical protein